MIIGIPEIREDEKVTTLYGHYTTPWFNKVIIFKKFYVSFIFIYAEVIHVYGTATAN